MSETKDGGSAFPLSGEQIEAALQAIADRRRKHKYQPADLITREFLQRIACESK